MIIKMIFLEILITAAKKHKWVKEHVIFLKFVFISECKIFATAIITAGEYIYIYES